jgi:hypothetical protein
MERQAAHAKRMAKLQRIRALAARAGDQEALARVEALAEKERARHHAFLSKKKAERRAQP